MRLHLFMTILLLASQVQLRSKSILQWWLGTKYCRVASCDGFGSSSIRTSRSRNILDECVFSNGSDEMNRTRILRNLTIGRKGNENN